MHIHFLKDLIHPSTGEPYEIKSSEGSSETIDEGQLVCGESMVQIRGGIPLFAGGELEPGEQQVQKVFSDLWNTVQVHGQESERWEFYLDGLKKILMYDHLEGEVAADAIIHYFDGKERILDAGCGQAWVANYFRANPQQKWYCVDFSKAVEIAQSKLGDQPNTFIAQASLSELPFQSEFFDLIFSMGVLHHMPEPKKAFDTLVKHLAPGGDFVLGLIRKQPPIRDFADSFARSISVGMGNEESKEFSKAMYHLARELQRHDVTLEVPPGLERLGIDRGQSSLHNFILVNFMKCFHSVAFSEAENIQHNRDWYAPEYAWAHTEEEVCGWFMDAGFRAIETWKPKNVGEKNQMLRIKATKT